MDDLFGLGLYNYSSPPLLDHPFCYEKVALWEASHEGEDWVVFYYFSAYEVWSNKRGGLSRGGNLVVFYYFSAYEI